jgi:3-dehydroquinate synthase II
VAGRIKVERRPMLLIRAKAGDKEGAVFLQNAETIRLVSSDGEAKSVVELAPGDKILCRLDEAGRHFGMRIKEAISES